MIAPLLVCAAMGMLFVPQDIDGVYVSAPNSLTGSVSKEFLQADIDRDALPDLVLSRVVAFQRDGAFPPEQRVPLPELSESARVDVSRDTLFFLLPDRLKAFRWVDGAWQNTLDQALVWPREAALFRNQHLAANESDDSPGVVYQRFLQDLDVDGTPEIVIPAPDGLHVYVARDGAYADVTVLNVYPASRIEPVEPATLWPREARRLTPVSTRMDCQVGLEGLKVTTMEREVLPTRDARFLTKVYALDPVQGFSVIPASVIAVRSAPVPYYAQAVRLNAARGACFAGTLSEWSETGILPVPMVTTYASTDGGVTAQTFRTPSFRVNCSFADFNGDGRLDMITESTGLYADGVRETIARYASQTTVNHEIGVRIQDENGKFPPTPTFRKSLTLDLGEVPLRNGAVFQAYCRGSLLDITGDVNKDGWRDLVVQEAPTRLVVYLCGPQGFADSPCAAITVQPGSEFRLTDINGDGRSDIVVTLPASGENAPPTSRVYFAREDKP